MASLERRYDGRYRIVFCYQGQRFYHSLGKVSGKDASSCKERLEENLRFVERGLPDVPPDADLGVFLVSAAKLNARPILDRPLTLRQLFARYQETHPNGAKEANTRYTEDIHIAHLLRLLGRNRNVRSINTQAMQAYVDARSLEAGRNGNAVSHMTVKKEVGTFAAVWNKWALSQGIVIGPAPTKGLIYRKCKAKPPFQTRQQIAQRIARGGLSAGEQKELWKSVFLTLSEILDLPEYVRAHAHRMYSYIMFCFAAFTGARRSEILRSIVDDFDLPPEQSRSARRRRIGPGNLPFGASLWRLLSVRRCRNGCTSIQVGSTRSAVTPTT
jgi:hypothetical protein